LHCAAEPETESAVHATLSLQLAGQLPSQVSPCSTIVFPQVGPQSLSTADVHPVGQQPSPDVQAVTGTLAHCALQLLALPVSVSAVQALESSHEVGQLPSQVSPASTTPLLQVAEQSSSDV